MSLKERLLKYWFIISSVGLAILYFLLDNRNKKLAKTLADVQTGRLAGKLEEIRSRATKTDTEYFKAMEDYYSLKRRHADLLKRLGAGPREEN